MGCAAMRTQQDVKHCEFSPNWLNEGQEFFPTPEEEENVLAITHECEGERQRCRCLRRRIKGCSMSMGAVLPVQDTRH